MLCKDCGNEYSPGDKFCQKCGSMITHEQINVPSLEDNAPKEANRPHEQEPMNNEPAQAEQPTPADTKRPPKLPVIVAAGIGVVAIIILLLVMMPGGSKYLKSSNAYNMLFYVDSGSYVVLTPENGTIDLDVEDDIDRISYSMGGTEMAFLADFFSIDGGTLYFMEGQTVTEVSDGVYSFLLNAEGNAIAYLADYGEDGGDLYLYDCKKKSKEKVAKEVYSIEAISPDGKSVGYIASYRNYDNYRGFISINGREPESVGKNCRPFAVSNNGKYVYYERYGNDADTLYVKAGKDDIKLGKYDSYSAFLNRDYSEILFSSEGRTYISAKGKDKIKVSNSNIRWLLKPAAMAYVQYGTIMVYGLDSFAGKVAVGDDNSLFYINKDFSSERISSGVSSNVLISDDMNTVLYANNRGSLFKVENLKKSFEPVEIGEDLEVVRFQATSDMKKIYYVNEDDDLYYIRGKSKPKNIAHDVEDILMNTKDDRLYFLEDFRRDSGTLYTTKNGSKKQAVENADEVASIQLYGDKVIYFEGDYNGFTLYISESPTKFEKLLEDIDYFY